MRIKNIHSILIFLCLSMYTWGQDVAYNDVDDTYAQAYELAYDGKNEQAQTIALGILNKDPDNIEVRTLIARTYSWSAQYEKARREFNKLTSLVKDNRDIWILAVKNELYANNSATAIGLANKALAHIPNDVELERLGEMARNRIASQEYPAKSWIDNSSSIPTKEIVETSKKKAEARVANKPDSQTKIEETVEKKEDEEKDVLNNRVAIRNSFTVFDQRYDPMVFSTIEFKRQTLAGSILPRINYSNRNGEQGLQYDLDFYPKFSKRFYAYLNYGYSNASIYPNHKVGGDLYVNLPGAIEFSAGGRFISLDSGDITAITNSIGHYRGNYYFSLRSNVIPKDDNLIQFSGSLLVRRYLKDAENFLSLNIGFGYSPELRQLVSGAELLAETVLFIESQRMSVQYQFTGKQNPNVYSASVGVSRQELSFQSGSFIWAVSAGLAYQVRF